MLVAWFVKLPNTFIPSNCPLLEMCKPFKLDLAAFFFVPLVCN